MQQQQPSSADSSHQQQFLRRRLQGNTNDAPDEACCTYYHDDDGGSQYLPNPVVIPEGETIRINCNTCTCRRQVRRSRASNNGHDFGPYLPDVVCTKHICLMEPHFTAHLNEHWTSFGWQAATNYSNYWGKTLQWGLKHRLGTHAPSTDAFNMIPVRVHGAEIETIPKEFDARERWRRSLRSRDSGSVLSKIVDQGSCGGSWAFSTVQVAQDRLNVIYTNRRRRHMRSASPSLLSIEQLLACDRRRNQLGCDGGGHVDRAWWYMRDKGVVGESCYHTRDDWWQTSDDVTNSTQRRHRMTPQCELSKPQQSGNQAIQQCPASTTAQPSSPSSAVMRYKTSPAYRIAPVVSGAVVVTKIIFSSVLIGILDAMHRKRKYKPKSCAPGLSKLSFAFDLIFSCTKTAYINIPISLRSFWLLKNTMPIIIIAISTSIFNSITHHKTQALRHCRRPCPSRLKHITRCALSDGASTSRAVDH